MGFNRTPEEAWEGFWKPIVSNPDGSINLEQIKKELFDFSQVMEIASTVYCHVTGSQVSKVLTDADVITSLADAHYERLYSEEY